MQKKHIISAALAVASLTSVALAGTAAPVVPLSVPPAPKVFSGALNVGYSSNYDFRGLVLSTSDGENMTPISLDTRYKVSRTTDITADFGYKAIWDKDIVQDNEFDFNLGVENKLNNYVTARLGYGLFQGGLPGIISQAEGNHSVSQEFNGGFRYDINGISSLMYATPEKDRAVLYVYKTAHFLNQTIPSIKLAGVDSRKRYRLKDITPTDEKKPSAFNGKTISGKILKEEGLQIPLNGEYASLVLELQEVN